VPRGIEVFFSAIINVNDGLEEENFVIYKAIYKACQELKHEVIEMAFMQQSADILESKDKLIKVNLRYSFRLRFMLKCFTEKKNCETKVFAWNDSETRHS
jgi:hypothetical protein